MGIAVWALIAYIVVIVVMNAVLKRNIGEAMLVGFIVVCLFGGRDLWRILRAGLVAGLSEEVVFAALTFVFMGFLLAELKLIGRQVDILNSIFGRFRGGAGYVSTISSALFGAVSGSGSGNAAAVGSITIPWMMRSNWTPAASATLVAGNAGLGIVFPPSSSMFLLLGSAVVAPLVTPGQLFVAMFVGGAWCLLHRLVIVFAWVRRDGIGRVPDSDIAPLRRTFGSGWQSLLIYLGILVPVLLTVEPGAGWVKQALGKAASDISVIVWIPVLVTIGALIIGRRQLPRSVPAWSDLLGRVAPRYAVIGATLFFAFTAAGSLAALGLPAQLKQMLAQLSAPPLVVGLLVGVFLLVVAAPLTGTATIAAVGGVGFGALIAAGAHPVAAAVAVIVFASTEGATPPGAAPIYIASGIAGVDPARTFVRLLVWVVLPTLLIGTAISVGWLPVPH